MEYALHTCINSAATGSEDRCDKAEPAGWAATADGPLQRSAVHCRPPLPASRAVRMSQRRLTVSLSCLLLHRAAGRKAAAAGSWAWAKLVASACMAAERLFVVGTSVRFDVPCNARYHAMLAAAKVALAPAVLPACFTNSAQQCPTVAKASQSIGSDKSESGAVPAWARAASSPDIFPVASGPLQPLVSSL